MRAYRRFVPRTAGIMLIGLLVILVSGVTIIAQDVIPERGLCNGAICGPSGALTVESLPTLTEIDWAAFPAYPVRPYQPRDGGREWFVAAEGHADNPGTADAPLATLNEAVDRAQSGDVIWVTPGTYSLGDADEYEALILATPG
ncbi:MAG: DUF1565 domain-containing protein, partial [Anaerolineae bacterium]|nr:DUF1565 domain-containing protein [Anaerolineae bacterium]